MRGPIGFVAAFSVALFSLSAVAASGGADRDKFRFVVRNPLPDATVGKPYVYSFCDGPQTRLYCGTLLKDAVNPHGGHPPYRFEKRFAANESIPFKLKLGLNGVLSGTPIPQAVPEIDARKGGRVYTFTVCAIDSKADAVCKQARLLVKPATPSSVTGTLQERVTERPVSDLTFTSSGDGTFSLTISTDGSVQGSGQISRTYAYSGVCSVQASDSATLTISGSADLGQKTLTIAFSAPEPPEATRTCGPYTVSTSSAAYRFPRLGNVTLALTPGATYENPRSDPCDPSDTCIVRIAVREVK